MAIPAITKIDASDKVRQVLQNLDKRVDESISSVFTDRGDPSGNDKSAGDFSDVDSDWHDLDLSSIVTNSDAKAILIKVTIVDNAVGSGVNFRKNGNSNAIAQSTLRTQVANEAIDFTFVIACDTSQVIEYLIATGTTFATLNLIVLGWWI